MNSTWLVVLGLVLGTACSPASGALGPTGYEQSLVKYKLGYSDPTTKKFLPDDWVLDNYACDPAHDSCSEKQGNEYRAVRWLDEDGDGTISESERTTESIFDLRFVNARDNAVIWLKVHPLAFSDSKRDLDVVLENYADGLAGTGLFEQSSLFNLTHDKARQYTTFVVSKEATTVGPLAAIKGVIAIADVEKLRLDASHRDSKAELVFARIKYLKRMKYRGDNDDKSLWPTTTKHSGGGVQIYQERAGLLVIGYYDDATRFDSHVADFQALLSRLSVPPEAVPALNTPPTIQPSPSAAPAAPAPLAPAAEQPTAAVPTAAAAVPQPRVP